MAACEKGDLDKPSRNPVGPVSLQATSTAVATWLCQCYITLAVFYLYQLSVKGREEAGANPI